MKKFSEIEYVRPDMEAEREKVRAYTKALKEAKSYEELRGLFMEEKTREDCLLYTSFCTEMCTMRHVQKHTSLQQSMAIPLFTRSMI